jgi:PAS domain S-box-containing protein
MRSFLAVPLMVRERMIGILDFLSRRPHAYGAADQRLAQRIADQIAGTIASAQLFEELKEAERSLRESEARFRALFEQTTFGVVETDFASGRYLRVNQRQCEILGMSEAELLATDSLSLTHPEDRQRHRRKGPPQGGEGPWVQPEKRYLCKDGRVVWVNVMATPLWRGGDAPERNLSVVEDITERRRMAEDLAESERRYRQIFEEASEGIFQSTPEGRYLSVNPAMAAMCGYASPEEMLAGVQTWPASITSTPRRGRPFGRPWRRRAGWSISSTRHGGRTGG